jgi:glycosyltransferase involved in cell wall biosynthesis
MTITSSLKQNEQRRQELELSETILCPSRFVISSIPTDVIKSKRVILAQYGMARVATSLPTKDLPTRRSDKRLRLLFVGQMSQRKGFADLLHALRKLSTPRVELTVVGSRFMDLSFYKHIYADFIYQPPMSRDRVFELMRSADLLVLPTLAEGRVLVVLEALANGLPVVTTVNSGCDDVIQEGLNGCLVPTSDVDALAATIDEFLKAPQRIDEMKRYMADQQPIAGWEPYRRSVVEAVS